MLYYVAMAHAGLTEKLIALKTYEDRRAIC